MVWESEEALARLRRAVLVMGPQLCKAVGLSPAWEWGDSWRLALSSGACIQDVHRLKNAAENTGGLFDAVGVFCFILIGDGFGWGGFLNFILLGKRSSIYID